MKNVRLVKVFLATAVTLGTLVAAAVEVGSPRQAMLDYTAAAQRGDVQAVRKLSWYGPGEHAAVDQAEAQSAVARAAFERAMGTKFGAEAVKPLQSLPGDDPAAVAAGREVITGTHAEVQLNASVLPFTVKLIKVENLWLLDYSQARTDPTADEKLARGTKAATAQIVAVTKDVAAGKYGDAQQAGYDEQERSQQAFSSAYDR